MSRPYLIAGIFGFVILVALIYFFGIGARPSTPPAVSLEIWSMYEDEEAWDAVIEAFRQTNPTVSVAYRKMTPASYPDTLLNALARGEGPDIFLLSSEQLFKEKDKIMALPSASSPITPAQFSSFFADGASALIGADGTLFGVPLALDSLALFYNKDMFDAAGFTAPPATWENFASYSQTLTRRSQSGDIMVAGAALGTGANMSRAMEIVSSLILQQGDPIARSDGHVELGEGARQALSFYSSFAAQGNQNYAWSITLPDALDAFATERAAMTFGASEDIAKVAAANPHLAFGVAPLPQFSGRTPRTYGTFRFPAVSRNSRNAATAWRFALFAAAGDGTKIYLDKTGLPPARRDLIAAVPAGSGTPAVFARQALTARTWPVPDERLARQIFGEAIDGMAQRAYTLSEALGRIRTRLQLLYP